MSAALLLALSLAAAPDAVAADLVLRGAEIHDGSGAEPVRGDLAIKGDRIAAVGRFSVAGSPREIDAAGLIVCPGFIDLHNHSDGGITREATRANLNFVTQGVTTIVTGNCGSGRVDVEKYFSQLAEAGAGTNVAHLVPQGAVRQQVIGDAKRPATEAELARMQELVDAGMKAGACGMSTGLIYVPSKYADTDELVALAKVVAEHGGLYASHIRDEGPGLLRSLEEILAIGQRANLPVHVSHMKASGRRAWGLAGEAVRALQAARAEGRLVTADQYPYVASSTSLSATLIPDEFRSTAALTAALQDEAKSAQLRRAVQQALDLRDGGKPIVIASFAPRRDWQGKNLADIAQAEKLSPLDLALDIQKQGGAQIVHFNMHEDDVRLIMRQPFVATASDGSAMVPADTVPHPRSYGCFPRKLGLYAIEEKIVPLAQAIRSASGLPADILRLDRRGYLRPGYAADVVAFDPQTFRDTATFDKPHQYATGVRWLLVNGELAVEHGKPTGKLSGQPLRYRPAK